MRVNLIPRELRPTRPSPVPYFPLFGLLAISGIWLLTQFAATGRARSDLRQHGIDLRKVSGQLTRFKGLPNRVTQVQKERDGLRMKAAAVTILTRSPVAYTGVLQALAESLPAELRLTDLSLDSGKGGAILLGYGSEERADIEVTTFLRLLNSNKTILATFSGVTLNFCNSTKQGDTAVKKFSISMQFREEKLKSLPGGEGVPAPKEGNGKKNGSKA